MTRKVEKDRVVQTGLRIRTSLRDKLEKAAHQSGISLNSEIERRIEESFQREIKLADLPKEVKESIASLHYAMAEGFKRVEAKVQAAPRKEALHTWGKKR